MSSCNFSDVLFVEWVMIGVCEGRVSARHGDGCRHKYHQWYWHECHQTSNHLQYVVHCWKLCLSTCFICWHFDLWTVTIAQRQWHKFHDIRLCCVVVNTDIYSFLPLYGTTKWYDRTGAVDESSIAAILEGVSMKVNADILHCRIAL